MVGRDLKPEPLEVAAYTPGTLTPPALRCQPGITLSIAPKPSELSFENILWDHDHMIFVDF